MKIFFFVVMIFIAGCQRTSISDQYLHSWQLEMSEAEFLELNKNKKGRILDVANKNFKLYIVCNGNGQNCVNFHFYRQSEYKSLRLTRMERVK